jgi:DUF1680 family protein
MPSIPGYMYAQKDDDVYVNLFISGSASLTMHNKPLQIIQQNNYPWDGGLAFTINPTGTQAFNLMVRIPGWARNEAIPGGLYTFQTASASKVAITVNGQQVDYTLKNGYAVLNRTWKKGDAVMVTLPMEVRRVVADNHIKDDIGKVALQRGPLMYCAEWVDNNGRAANIIMPSGATFTVSHDNNMLNGITVLQASVPAVNVDTVNNIISTATQTLKAIPYYAWANRGEGEMMLWFPEKVKDIDLISNIEQVRVTK